MFLVHEGELAVWTSRDGEIWAPVDAVAPVDMVHPALNVDPRLGVSSSENVAIFADLQGPPAATTVWIMEIVTPQ